VEVLVVKSRFRMLRVAPVVAVTWLLTLPPAARAGVDLTGAVLTTAGAPIPRASVYIYTASPRTGTSVFCPSCYPDCGKRRETDGKGRFKVTGLDDSLLFQVLIAAPGYEPSFAKKVDPAAGPLQVQLEARDARGLDPARTIRGRVTDTEGRPVVGATVEPEGYHEAGSASFGRYPGTDPVAISDQAGWFVLLTGQATGAWDLRVRARNLTPTVVHEIPVGGDSVAIRLYPGAIVTGRVLHDGHSLSGVVVGLAQVISRSGCLTYGTEQIATDGEGRFSFVNVTPGQDYWLYGTLESFRAYGVASSQRLTLGERDTAKVLSPIIVTAGHRIIGRVRLADGKPLPPGTRVTISREPLGGAAILLLDPSGRFECDGLPEETVHLMVRVPGYRMPRGTPGYEDASSRTVVVERDRDDIEVVLEPE
jgi:hypothetical protein